ncbi:MAG TPA: VTT domain-containing protein [Rhodopila sp.]|nr:VTT domain-containing protein [Rhodopila sp.]
MTIGDFLIAHGSALILPLAVVEGPVVTVVTGFLASQGYFTWYWMLPLLVGGDVVGDVFYYAVGRTGVASLGRVGRWLCVRDAMPPALRDGLERNAGRMWLIGKWTHAIGGVVLVGSGMLRLPLWRFILVNLLATIPKSAVLFGCGWFAGDHYPFLERHYVLGLAVLCVVGLVAAGVVLRRTERVGVAR